MCLFIASIGYYATSVSDAELRVQGRPASASERAVFPYVFVLAGIAMASAGVGMGVSSSSLGSGGKRWAAAIVALVWHSVGVGVCVQCLALPDPPLWVLVEVAIYEWLGLAPLALAIPDGAISGRIRSATWALMVGIALGAVVGVVLGAIAGGIVGFVSYLTHGARTGDTWYVYGLVGGAVVCGVILGALTLLGVLDTKSGPAGRARRPAIPVPAKPAVCRRCRQQVQPGLDQCPYCRAPLAGPKRQAVGPGLTALGTACLLLGMVCWFAAGGIGGIAPGLARTVESITAGVPLALLFWPLFLLGLVLVWIGNVLSPPRNSHHATMGEDEPEKR